MGINKVGLRNSFIFQPVLLPVEMDVNTQSSLYCAYLQSYELLKNIQTIGSILFGKS